MSNVSVILCVPHIIKVSCYSIINTVTEPMQCNYSTLMSVVNTNKIGAFKRVYVKNESQHKLKIIENIIYIVDFVESIQQNQIIGETPIYCIPLMITAITVQGISYSDPYFGSFKLKYKMALGAPEYMNKSDYAFKFSVGILRNEPCTDKTQLLNEKSVHDMEITRMINDEKVMREYHDNIVSQCTDDESVAKGVIKMFANGDLTLDAMIELARNEQSVLKEVNKVEGVDSWNVPMRFRLRGGGESSLNTAATGWGSPPASNNNAGNWGGNSSGQTNNGSNNPPQQWNNTTQRPPTSQADMNSNKGNSNQMPPTSAATGQNWQSSSSNMPNSQPNGNGAPTNNGTANPANATNGTNPSNAVANTNGPTTTNVTNGNNIISTSSAKIEHLNSMREALFSQDGWGGQHVNQDTNWDVPGSPEPGSKVEPSAGGPPAWKPTNNGAFLGTDLWEANLRNGGQPPPQPAAKTPWGHTPTTNIGGTWGEDDDAADSTNVWTGPPPPQQWPAVPPQHAQQWGVPKKDDWNAWGESHRPTDPRLDAHRSSDPRQPPNDPRHDLRGGISGRLNGDMWSQHHQHGGGPNKMMPSINQWGGQGPKDSIKPSGWEEPSPPAARRATGGFDDGTSLWAQRAGMAAMGGRGLPQGPPAPPRIQPTPTKPDGVWGSHAQRNGSWDEPPHTPAWPERDVPGWSDSSGPALWSLQKPKQGGPAGVWPDEIGEWGGPKPPQSGPLGKQLPKELVWNSKQFRFLVEMGYKKEEAEAALRSRDMNAEEALEMLAAARSADGWRRDEHFSHHGAPFQPPPSVPTVPAVVQKLMNQPPPQAVHHHSFNPNSSSGNSGQPSTAQLRMLVQQIQMAVSAGYLNHQILNQPLAPQTLVLLNQLLQQIKVLQQLVQQHTLTMSKANSSLALQYSVQITKTKQQITALQNQISTQQALYMKQQAGSADLFKQTHDPLAQLQNNFTDMSLAKESQAAYGGASGNQQSRLNQWKLPSLDKDSEVTDFSRAPGTAKSTTSPQLNPLSLQPDSTWGVGRGNEGWGDSSADVADGKDAWPSHPQHQPVYDLVPEFEPGKPWKGNQMKNVEDDPAMTPGSVVRSPLSLTAIKDTDMLGGKTSPPGGERSLSSSTWSYAPPTSGSVSGLKPSADAWGAKPRAPPPGLNKGWPQHHTTQQRLPSWQSSTWLLLKNLTAQIDGSTLKTLCVQHGPLQNFHLYLNQGLALARYSTREEAAKAQMALNNCVLSNTTIFAESPAESEVQLILQHLGSGGGGAWRGGGGGGGGAKDSAWGGFPGLWSDQHDQRATPSSLNSFLPPDLLGGESI